VKTMWHYTPGGEHRKMDSNPKPARRQLIATKRDSRLCWLEATRS
jgi:hypothetical protein